MICITEGVPVIDAIRAVRFIEERGGTRLIGPNCPGAMTPTRRRSGSCRARISLTWECGRGVAQRTLTYEVVDLITKAGMGVSTCVGVGGDPVIGTTFVDVLKMFAADEQTAAV